MISCSFSAMLCVQLGSDYQIILTKKENWV